MTEERAKVVTDPIGRQKRRPNLSAMHQADDVEAVERRRDEAVARLRETRAELARDLADLAPAEGFFGERWSAMHVLWHLAGEHTHIEEARRIVDGGTEPPSRGDAAELNDAIARAVRNIDEWIAYSGGLTREQLVVHARRMNRDYYVVGMVESTAEHLIDHASQIREMKAKARAQS